MKVSNFLIKRSAFDIWLSLLICDQHVIVLEANFVLVQLLLLFTLIKFVYWLNTMFCCFVCSCKINMLHVPCTEISAKWSWIFSVSKWSPFTYIRHQIQIHLCAVLIQGISTIFTDQMPTFHVFRKVHSVLESEFLTVYHLVSSLKKEKAQLKVALRRYLNTGLVYSVDKFIMCKDL